MNRTCWIISKVLSSRSTLLEYHFCRRSRQSQKKSWWNQLLIYRAQRPRRKSDLQLALAMKVEIKDTVVGSKPSDRAAAIIFRLSEAKTDEIFLRELDLIRIEKEIEDVSRWCITFLQNQVKEHLSLTLTHSILNDFPVGFVSLGQHPRQIWWFAKYTRWFYSEMRSGFECSSWSKLQECCMQYSAILKSAS